MRQRGLFACGSLVGWKYCKDEAEYLRELHVDWVRRENCLPSEQKNRSMSKPNLLFKTCCYTYTNRKGWISPSCDNTPGSSTKGQSNGPVYYYIWRSADNYYHPQYSFAKLNRNESRLGVFWGNSNVRLIACPKPPREV